MTDPQNRKYILTALNGMNIEAVGTKNRKIMADLFSGYKLRIAKVEVIKPRK